MAEVLEGSWAWCGCGEVPGQAEVVQVVQEDQGRGQEEAWKGMEGLTELVCLFGLSLPSIHLAIPAHPPLLGTTLLPPSLNLP